MLNEAEERVRSRRGEEGPSALSPCVLPPAVSRPHEEEEDRGERQSQDPADHQGAGPEEERSSQRGVAEGPANKPLTSASFLCATAPPSGQRRDCCRRLDVPQPLGLPPQVNKDFGSIFSTLLPGATAKLAPPHGSGVLEGLEFKVALGTTWKENLSELSGGQRLGNARPGSCCARARARLALLSSRWCAGPWSPCPSSSPCFSSNLPPSTSWTRSTPPWTCPTRRTSARCCAHTSATLR